jgi:ABC-type branched-subunit amino acid transport system substrate-binding protein
MNRSHRVGLASIAGIAALALAVAGCSSGASSSAPGAKSGGSGLTASAPGITPTSILLGSTQPLTGIAAPGYSNIGPGANAYFQYVNAHGGVYGRKITYKYLDDAYNPTQTVTDTHQLVLQDNVFAIFNALGTPTHLNVVSFLNSNKVPDMFVASGCLCWNNTGTYPETFGWQTDYVREGKILGSYIAKNFKGMKIGYLYQNDDFGQGGVKGLDAEIPHAQVVDREPYNVAAANPAQEVGGEVAKLKAAGAQVVVSFTVPAFTALMRLSEVTLNYSPKNVVSVVGTDPATLTGLLNTFAKKSVGATLIQGMITDGYLPSIGQTSNSWISLFKTIHDTYDASKPFDGNTLYGEAAAYTFVQAMFKAGKNPTRADLVNVLNTGNFPQGVSVAPYAYASGNHAGMTGAYIGVINNGVIVQQGPVLVTDDSTTGPVTALTAAPPTAPVNGVPSP